MCVRYLRWKVRENVKDTNGRCQWTCYPTQTSRLVKHGKTTALLDPHQSAAQSNVARLMERVRDDERGRENDRKSRIYCLRLNALIMSVMLQKTQERQRRTTACVGDKSRAGTSRQKGKRRPKYYWRKLVKKGGGASRALKESAVSVNF